MITLFLGGTCNNSKWRDELVKLLDLSKIKPFNPVVEHWTPECQAEEIKQRETSDYVLYVITPAMTGFYSIFELTEDSIKRSQKILFCVLDQDYKTFDGAHGSVTTLTQFDRHQLKSLEAGKKLVAANGVKVFGSLEEIAKFLNNEKN